MNLAFQTVNNNVQEIAEDVSFFSEYKYWIFFGILFIIIFTLGLYRRRKQMQSIKQIGNLVDETHDETISAEDSIAKPIPEKKGRDIKAVKPQGAKNPVIEEIVIKEEPIRPEDLIEKSAPVKKRKEKQLAKPKVVKEQVEKSKKVKKKTPKKSLKPQVVEEVIIEEIISVPETKGSKIKTIGYEPTDIFEQEINYSYPLVLMPKLSAKIKFPRNGCSNKQGYTEDVFFEYMQNPFAKDFQILNNRHIPSKNGNFVYEPDIVLINEKNGKNILIDIEIDEPYEAFSRTPTHEVDKDKIRNKFFTDRGWIVIRFSEIQIHQDPKECCYHIAKVIAAIDSDYEIPFHLSLYGDLEQKDSWDSLQAKKWAKQNYREDYLGIKSFGIRPNIIFNYDIVTSTNDELLEGEDRKAHV